LTTYQGNGILDASKRAHMRTMTVAEVKTQFSRLLCQVEKGEES
jgi:hypothetical protein